MLSARTALRSEVIYARAAQAKWKGVNKHFPGPPNAPERSPDKGGASSRPEDGWGGYEQADSGDEQETQG